MRPKCALVDNLKTIHVWVSLKGQGYSAKAARTNKKDFLPAPRALHRLYSLSRRQKPSTRTPERFPQHVARTEDRRWDNCIIFIRSTLRNPGLYLCPRSTRPSSTLPPPLLMSLFRRC
ncbi:hypothetical protein DPMN_149949 [Dreissena polymorpha]|uniref:Uncharacterized protein n=1 Tax=Dreissena polymorpha TaxID=45954 RepID=A0A9D4FEH1_DREPO|nr:hypothetical protein DPMN_149949 [Dreissena polymorpha]